MGGNDFLTNFHGISHSKLLSTIAEDHHLMRNLFKFEMQENKRLMKIIEEQYLEVIKRLYCPSDLNHNDLTFDQIRQLSIKLPNKNFRSPQQWMPPMSALKRLAALIQCQIDYFLTSWNHSSMLPDFVSYGCLCKTDK